MVMDLPRVSVYVTGSAGVAFSVTGVMSAAAVAVAGPVHSRLLPDAESELS
jgi:hypothetical protein